MTTTSQRIVIKEMADDAHLHKDAKKYLMPVFPKTAKFYYLPKIHNPPLPNRTIPGRPIVSSCGAPTERISEYVDHHLQPLVLSW